MRTRFHNGSNPPNLCQLPNYVGNLEFTIVFADEKKTFTLDFCWLTIKHFNLFLMA